MELIDRYVKDVTRRLPEKRRPDVERELRSAIMDVVDGRGATTDDEVVAVLREFGDPAAVAASYDPSGQYLIGPELYPAYRRVLGQTFAIVIALACLWFAVLLATGRAEPMSAGDELLGVFELALRAGIGSLVGITAVFVVLQRHGATKTLPRREWDPRTLPDVNDADRVKRLEVAFSLFMLAIALSIVGAIGHEAGARIDRAPAILRPLIGGALLESIPWLIGSMLVEVLMQAGLLIEGRRRPWWRALHVLSDGLAVIAFGIAATAVFAQRSALLAVGMPGAGVTALGGGLVVVALVIAFSSVMRERQLARNRAAAHPRPLPTPPAVLA